MQSNETEILTAVLGEYGFQAEDTTVRKFGTGHINSTWLVSSPGRSQRFILQRINEQVFREPLVIAENMRLVAEYLNRHFPEYLFVKAIPTRHHDQMAVVSGTYWRLTEYVENSIAYDTLNDPGQAYEAAKQFGKLSRLLDGFDASQLKPGIPGFHDLGLRYAQFREALKNAGDDIKDRAANEIKKIVSYSFILDFYNSYKNSPDFPDRVMHHDTKISNMLFDKSSNKGLCVIDLDTLMPGKFISDLGDMMRTYLTAYSENEPDLDKIFIRMDYFEAIIDGYLSEMGGILTNVEKDLILFSGKYLIYMQALRFLTDFLMGNIYYPVSYPDHNLVRVKNQLKLLSEFFTHEKILQTIIDHKLSQ